MFEIFGLRSGFKLNQPQGERGINPDKNRVQKLKK